MFNKYFNIFVFLIFSHFLKYDNDYYNLDFKNDIDFFSIGGRTIINGQEISINFFGNLRNPPSFAKWKIEKKEKRTILKYTDEDGITFIQNWDFSNKTNPILTITVEHKGKELDVLTHLVIKSDDFYSDQSKILCNFEKFSSFNAKYIHTMIFDRQDGWIAIKNRKNIFIVHSNNSEYVIKNGSINLKNEQNGKDITNCEFSFHVSPIAYNFIKNNKSFKDLDRCLEFSYFGRISHIMFKFINFLMYYFKNLYICLFLVILLMVILIWPFMLESLKMHELVFYADPEIKAAETIYQGNFEAFNREKNKIFERHNISIFKQIFGQVLLILPLSILNDISINLTYFNLVPSLFGFSEYYMHILLVICIAFTIALYTHFTLYIQQPFIVFFISFFYISYEKLTLIGLIIVHLLIMLLGFSRKLLNNGKY